MKLRKMQNKELKSVNQLLGVTSQKASEEDSYLVRRCKILSDVPICEFSIEDYRILIGQGIGLEYLVPPAINILSENLFAEGDYYEGDLLKSLLTVDRHFWDKHSNLREELKQICLQSFNAIQTLDLSDEIKNKLQVLVEEFYAIE